MGVSLALGLAVSLLLAPACIFLSAARVLRPQRGNEIILLELCFAIAPAFLGRLITWMLRVYPGQSLEFYVAATGVALGMLALAGRACIPSSAAIRKLATGIQQHHVALAGTAALAILFIIGTQLALGERPASNGGEFR